MKKIVPAVWHGLKSSFLFINEKLHKTRPVLLVTVGYLLYVIFGWIFLSLPFSQKTPISALDNLFTSTSAVSTTGLTTIDVNSNYTFFGQIVILLLIQLGGIGYMTFSSFVILSGKRPMSAKREKISSIVFSLPAEFKIEKFIKSVMIFTLILEAIGAIFLYFIFLSTGTSQPLWNAVFHSVSTFCTAGFSLFNTSFEKFYGNFALNLVVSILSLAGAIGFIVFVDFWRSFTGKIKGITLTSKIIIRSTLLLIISATVLVFITDPLLNKLPPVDRLITSFFQTMSASTTVGFNSVPIAGLSKGTLLIITLLMLIGASPSGTGGGIKTTSVTAIWGVIRSTLAGKEDVSFMKRIVPLYRIRTAIATLAFYLGILAVGTYFLMLTEAGSFIEILFEASSALGTVGLSMGITSNLTQMGKLIIVGLMFIGRLGPLTFGMSFFNKKIEENEIEREDLAV